MTAVVLAFRRRLAGTDGDVLAGDVRAAVFTEDFLHASVHLIGSLGRAGRSPCWWATPVSPPEVVQGPCRANLTSMGVLGLS